MADFVSTARSNYFRVKDPDTFRAAMAQLSIDVEESLDTPGLFGVFPNDGSWPTERYDEDTDTWHDVDFLPLLASHLADGEVAILNLVGSEKLRYLEGQAHAVNSKGETRTITLHDIQELARELTDRPDDITLPIY